MSLGIFLGVVLAIGSICVLILYGEEVWVISGIEFVIYLFLGVLVVSWKKIIEKKTD